MMNSCLARPTLRTVYLVDDNPADNFIHQRVFERSGINADVVAYDNALRALEALRDPREPRPDLVLLDLNMPHMSGWEFLEPFVGVLEELQEDVLLIVLTTSDNPADRNRALAHPVVADFYIKPLTDEALTEIAGRHFQG